MKNSKLIVLSADAAASDICPAGWRLTAAFTAKARIAAFTRTCPV